MMDAVRRLLGLAGHLNRLPYSPPLSQQAPDTLEELRDLWCVPWRPLQSHTALQATARLLANLRPPMEGGPSGQFFLDQVQLVVRVLHVCAMATPSPMPMSMPMAIPGLPSPHLLDMQASSLLTVLEAAAAVLVPWAASLSPPLDDLSSECLCRAALSASSSCTLPAPPLSTPNSSSSSPPLPVSASLLLLHAGRCHALSPPTALSHLCPLWAHQPSLCLLLAPPYALHSLTALLSLLPPEAESMEEVYVLAVSAVARMGPSLPLTLTLLETFMSALKKGVQGDTQRRTMSLEAVLRVVQLSKRGGLGLEGAVAGAAAAALLTTTHTHSHDGTQMAQEQQVWRALVEVCRQSSNGTQTHAGAEGQAIRATLLVALAHIGLHASPSAHWGVDVSECLGLLLPLALHSVSDSVAAGGAEERGPLMQQVLDGLVLRSGVLCSSLVSLLLHPHCSDVARTQALSTLHAYCTTITTITEQPDITPTADIPTADITTRGSPAVQLPLQLYSVVLSSSPALGFKCVMEATWVLDSLAHLATHALHTPLESLLSRALDGLAHVLESQQDDSLLAPVRDHALRQWAHTQTQLQHTHPSSWCVRALDRRVVLWQRACVRLTLDTPTPPPYTLVTHVISQLLLCLQALPPASSLSRQEAHRRLRSVVANPRVLAYRAGPQQHWDEARRRVLVNYVQAALCSFPSLTSEQDLAYCIGSAIGGLPHDAEGQGVLLACLSLLRDRARELWAQDPEGQDSATTAVTKLLYQALVMCPPRTLKAGLQCTSDFVASLDTQGARRGALAILRDILGSDNEGMRQAELVKWYLVVVDRLVKK